MGWTLSNTEFEFHGEQKVRAHPDGNNVAWICPKCGHPVLFVYLRGRIGSSRLNPTVCRGCGARYYISPEYTTPPPPRETRRVQNPKFMKLD